MELKVEAQWRPDGSFLLQCNGADVTPEQPLKVVGGAVNQLEVHLRRSDGSALPANTFTKAYLAVVCEGEVLAAIETGHTAALQTDGSFNLSWNALPVNGEKLRAKVCDRRLDETTSAAPLRRDYEGMFSCCRCAFEIAGFAAADDSEPQIRMLIPAAVFPRLFQNPVPEETQRSYFYTKTEADVLLAAKQAAITGGTQGQVVGFDEDGKCVPQAAPSAETVVSTISAVSGTVTIPDDGGHVYLYTAVAGDDFVFTTPASGTAPEFEIDLRQPDGGAVSFTLPEGIVWRFGSPDLSTAGKLYQLKFRYLSGTWEGWTTPEMSEYAKLSGGTFTGSVTVGLPSGESYFYLRNGYGGVYIGGDASVSIGYSWDNTQTGWRALSVGSYHNDRSGAQSFRVGRNLYCIDSCSVATGKYNLSGTHGARVTGGGTADNARKNIEVLDWDGNLTLAGDLTVTLNGSTVTLASLVARIEALEQA